MGTGVEFLSEPFIPLMSKTKSRKFNRFLHYDYSQEGYYFVTICTKNFMNYFGIIDDEEVNLNRLGVIAQKCWGEIPEHFENILLDEFVVMPNHVHGILIINSAMNNDRGIYSVGNADLRSLQDRTKMLLPKVVHGYKSSVTRLIRKQFNNHYFAWQKSYYDHVIRTERSLAKIREYIRYNTLKWHLDKYNPDNLI